MGLATVGIGVVLAAWALRDTGAGAPPASPPAIAAPPAQTLSVWLTVQKMRDGQPYQDEFISSGQEIFESGWKFRLNASSPDRTVSVRRQRRQGAGGSDDAASAVSDPWINDGSAQSESRRCRCRRDGMSSPRTRAPRISGWWPRPSLCRNGSRQGRREPPRPRTDQRRRAAGGHPGVACAREPPAPASRRITKSSTRFCEAPSRFWYT